MLPVDPTGAEARDLLRRELAKSDYPSSSAWDRLLARIGEWWTELLSASGGAGFGATAISLILVFVCFLAAAWLISRVRRVAQSPAPHNDLFTRAPVSSSELWIRARTAFDSSDYSQSVIEGMRAFAQAHAEQGLLILTPGLTAHEAAVTIAEHRPAISSIAHRAAEIFDQVRYAQAEASREQAEVLLSMREMAQR